MSADDPHNAALLGEVGKRCEAASAQNDPRAALEVAYSVAAELYACIRKCRAPAIKRRAYRLFGKLRDATGPELVAARRERIEAQRAERTAQFKNIVAQRDAARAERDQLKRELEAALAENGALALKLLRQDA